MAVRPTVKSLPVFFFCNKVAKTTAKLFPLKQNFYFFKHSKQTTQNGFGKIRNYRGNSEEFATFPTLLPIPVLFPS